MLCDFMSYVACSRDPEVFVRVSAHCRPHQLSWLVERDPTLFILQCFVLKNSGIIFTLIYTDHN